MSSARGHSPGFGRPFDPRVTCHLPVDPARLRWRRTRPALFRPRITGGVLVEKRRVPVEGREQLLGLRSSDALRFEVGPEALEDRFLSPVERLLIQTERPRHLGDAQPHREVQAQEQPLAPGQPGERAPDHTEGPLRQGLALDPLELRRGREGTARLGVDGPLSASIPRGEPQAHVVERVRGLAHPGIRAEDAACLVEGEAVAVQQALEAHRHRSEATGLGRRSPLSEALHLEIEVKAVDHHRQVGLERAAPLELPEDLVVVFDEAALHRGGEVLGVGAAQAAPRAHPADHPFDDGKLREEQLLASHRFSWKPATTTPRRPSGLRRSYALHLKVCRKPEDRVRLERSISTNDRGGPLERRRLLTCRARCPSMT